MKIHTLLSIALTAALCLPAAGSAEEYALSDESRITYFVQHPMHDVEATGDKLKLLKPVNYDPGQPNDFSGIANIPVQAAWESFDSGNANRDANTRMVVKASQFPQITYVVEKIGNPAPKGEKQYTALAEGRMYIAGKKNPVTATLDINAENPERLVIKASLAVQMTDFDIDPPKLLMIAANNNVAITTELVLIPAGTGADQK